MNLAGIKAFVGLAALTFAGLAAAHPVLEFVEHTEIRPNEKSNVKAASAEQTLRVTLGRNYVSMDEKDTRMIIDFEKRRVFNLKLGEKTYVEASLFAPVGFADMELQNRLRLHAVLDAAKVDTSTMTPALVEHLFSLQAAGQNTVIDGTRENGATVYRWQGKELLAISDKSQPLPLGYQPQLWRWMRHRIGGHPKIYAAMDSRTGVPEMLKMLRPDIAEKIITLRLASVTNGPDVPYSLAGFTRAEPTREPLRTLEKVGTLARSGFDARTDAAVAARNASAAQDRIFDSLLAHLSLTVSIKDAGNDWLAAARDRIAVDPDSRAVLAALGATTAEQQTKGIGTLGALRAKTSSPHAYMLDLYAANLHVMLRQPAEAQKLFLAALSANPHLTGAWFDLGKLYFNTFRTEEAWNCWDTARAINPDHPLVRDVGELERKIMAAHPEFF
jgi:tetratricopeptide (TPR) repeat protein